MAWFCIQEMFRFDALPHVWRPRPRRCSLRWASDFVIRQRGLGGKQWSSAWPRAEDCRRRRTLSSGERRQKASMTLTGACQARSLR